MIQIKPIEAPREVAIKMRATPVIKHAAVSQPSEKLATAYLKCRTSTLTKCLDLLTNMWFKARKDYSKLGRLPSIVKRTRYNNERAFFPVLITALAIRAYYLKKRRRDCGINNALSYVYEHQFAILRPIINHLRHDDGPPAWTKPMLQHIVDSFDNIGDQCVLSTLYSLVLHELNNFVMTRLTRVLQRHCYNSVTTWQRTTF